MHAKSITKRKYLQKAMHKDRENKIGFFNDTFCNFKIYLYVIIECCYMLQIINILQNVIEICYKNKYILYIIM